jgi:hypothetical protein
MTSQLYFDDAINERVIARAPYTTHGRRIQKNSEDGLFRRNGSRLMLTLAEAGPGFAGDFHVGLKTS